MQETRELHGGDAVRRSTAVFARPFTLPGLDEVLPAGEYDLEIELTAPPDHLTPNTWAASVLVHLHPRVSHPGLRRTLSVSLGDLETAIDRDTWSSKELERLLLEEMLADPMIRLVMRADGVSDAELRAFYEDFYRRNAAEPTPQRVLADAAVQGIRTKTCRPGPNSSRLEFEANVLRNRPCRRGETGGDSGDDRRISGPR